MLSVYFSFHFKKLQFMYKNEFFLYLILATFLFSACDWTRIKDEEIGEMEEMEVIDKKLVIKFDNTYGNNDYKTATAICQSDDGGYLLAGFTRPQQQDFCRDDIYIVKTDSIGEIEWDTTLINTGISTIRSIVRTNDGNEYLLAGYKSISVSSCETQGLLIRLSKSMKILETELFPEGGFNKIKTIVRSSRGGYLLAGSSTDPNNGESKILLIKIEDDLTFDWQNDAIGMGKINQANAIVEVPDGYLIAGYTSPTQDDNDNDAFLLKIGFDGNLIDIKNYGTDFFDRANGLATTQDGSFMISGFIKDTLPSGVIRDSLYLIKVNEEGQDIGERKAYGGLTGTSIISTSDNHFVVSGFTNTAAAFIMKIDKEGNKIWQEPHSDANNVTFATSLIETKDCGFGVVGSVVSSTNGQFYFIKTDSIGGI